MDKLKIKNKGIVKGSIKKQFQVVQGLMLTNVFVY